MKNTVHALYYLLLFVFSVQTLTGQENTTTVYSNGDLQVSSYDFKGFEPLLHQSDNTTYIINFWATWCAPCIAELPYFESINREYADKNVKVILVSLDFKKQVEKSLLPFLKRKNIQSKVVHLSDPDANAWIDKVDPKWSGAIPATLIYHGKSGKREFYEKSFTQDELFTTLENFLVQ